VSILLRQKHYGGREARRPGRQLFSPPPGELMVQQCNIGVFAKEFCDFWCNKSAKGSATDCNVMRDDVDREAELRALSRVGSSVWFAVGCFVVVFIPASNRVVRRDRQPQARLSQEKLSDFREL
jgi:hypothetical protein